MQLKTAIERAKAGRPELETRLRDLDRDGIDAEVIYPNRGLLMWASPDPAHQTAMCKVWNDWALEFFAPQKQRCAPVAAVAPKDVETAVKEVERVAKLDYRTVFLPMQVQDQPYNLPLYDPLWAAIQETLSTAIEPVVQLCASGVCERFPKLRFGTIEAGIGWLAWTLWVMDEGYKKHHFWVAPKLSMLPSDYFRRHWLVSRDGEEGDYFYDGPGGAKTTHEVLPEAIGLRLRWWPPSNQVDLNLEFGPLPTLAEDYFFSARSEATLTVAAMDLVR